MRAMILGVAFSLLMVPAAVCAGGWFEFHGGLTRLEMDDFNSRVEALNELEYAWELPPLYEELEGGASLVLPFAAG